MRPVFRPAHLTVAFALPLLCAAALPEANATSSVEEKYVAGCDSQLQRNNPIWNPKQRRQICGCRYAKLAKEFPPEQIAALGEAMLNRDTGMLDLDLREANINSSAGCRPRR